MSISKFKSQFCLVVVALLTITLTGCATNKSIDSVGKVAIQNKTLAVITGERPKFVVHTPGKSFLASQGLLGFLAVHALSEDLAKTYNIADPAIAIGNKVKARLSSGHNMKLVSASKSAQYELKVYSTAFGAKHEGMVGDKYFSNYGATAELREMRTNSVVAQANCNYKGGTKGATEGPTYGELFANQAAILKAQVANQVNRCANTIMQQIFNSSKKAS